MTINNLFSFITGSGVSFILTYIMLIQRVVRIETKLDMHLKQHNKECEL